MQLLQTILVKSPEAISGVHTALGYLQQLTVLAIFSLSLLLSLISVNCQLILLSYEISNFLQ